MRWFAWGKQASIYGIPLGLALIMIAFLQLFNVADVWGMVDGNRNLIGLWGGLTACHVKMGPWGWREMRTFWLLKIVVQVLWAFSIFASVAVWRHTDTLRKLMLYMPWVYFGQMTYTFGYTLWAFLHPDDRWLAEQETYYLIRYKVQQSILPWPRRFYILFPLACVFFFFYCVMIWDAHLSYYRVLEVGGSGWESQAFYQIHIQSKDTVDSLQQQWDRRLGLESKKKRDPEDEEDDERVPLGV